MMYLYAKTQAGLRFLGVWALREDLARQCIADYLANLQRDGDYYEIAGTRFCEYITCADPVAPTHFQRDGKAQIPVQPTRGLPVMFMDLDGNTAAGIVTAVTSNDAVIHEISYTGGCRYHSVPYRYYPYRIYSSMTAVERAFVAAYTLREGLGIRAIATCLPSHIEEAEIALQVQMLRQDPAVIGALQHALSDRRASKKKR